MTAVADASAAVTIDLDERPAVVGTTLTTINRVGEDGGLFVQAEPGVWHSPTVVTPLPMPGDWISATDHQGRTWRGHWAGLLDNTIDTDGPEPVVRALVVTDQTANRVTFPVLNLDARVVVALPARAGARERDLLAVLGQEVRTHEQAEQRHERWRDDLVEDAHRYADEQGLCYQFDDFMTDHGLPRRMHEYPLLITVKVEVHLTSMGADEDDAVSNVNAQAVLEALAGRGVSGLSDRDIEWDAESD